MLHNFQCSMLAKFKSGYKVFIFLLCGLEGNSSKRRQSGYNLKPKHLLFEDSNKLQIENSILFFKSYSECFGVSTWYALTVRNMQN